MKKTASKIWFWLSLILIGYAGGIVTGVVVDADQVYHTTVKKIRQNRSPDGQIVVDVTAPETKSKKEIRQDKRADRKENR